MRFRKFPYFNEELGEVLTLGNAVNECRVKHGLAKLSYQKQDLANLLAYLTFLERGTRRGTATTGKRKRFASLPTWKGLLLYKAWSIELVVR